MDLENLKALAIRNSARKHAEYYNGKLWEAEQADLGVTITAADTLALLARLALAERVVDAVRYQERARHGCDPKRDIHYVVPSREFNDVWNAVCAYDRATAEAAKEVGDA